MPRTGTLGPPQSCTIPTGQNSGIAKRSLQKVQAMFSRPMFSRPMFSRLALYSIAAAIALALLSNGVGVALAQNDHSQRVSEKGASEKAGAAPGVARGKYLVEGVAVCGQCHTPRDASGNLDRTRWLQGGSVPYLPASPARTGQSTRRELAALLPPATRT